jgi:hypothetical protein
MTGVILRRGTLLKIQISLLCSQYNCDIPIQETHHLKFPSSEIEVL